MAGIMCMIQNLVFNKHKRSILFKFSLLFSPVVLSNLYYIMERVTKLFESVKMPRLEKEHAVPAVISIVAATTILYSSYRFVSDSNRKKKQGTREIPSPGSSYPYVGHMLSLGELPGRKVAEWHKELGPILKLKMGSKTWIMLDDPVLAQKIFVSRGADTSERPYSNYTQNIYGMNGK